MTFTRLKKNNNSTKFMVNNIFIFILAGFYIYINNGLKTWNLYIIYYVKKNWEKKNNNILHAYLLLLLVTFLSYSINFCSLVILNPLSRCWVIDFLSPKIYLYSHCSPYCFIYHILVLQVWAELHLHLKFDVRSVNCFGRKIYLMSIFRT